MRLQPVTLRFEIASDGKLGIVYLGHYQMEKMMVGKR